MAYYSAARAVSGTSNIRATSNGTLSIFQLVVAIVMVFVFMLALQIIHGLPLYYVALITLEIVVRAQIPGLLARMGAIYILDRMEQVVVVII